MLPQWLASQSKTGTHLYSRIEWTKQGRCLAQEYLERVWVLVRFEPSILVMGSYTLTFTLFSLFNCWQLRGKWVKYLSESNTKPNTLLAKRDEPYSGRSSLEEPFCLPTKSSIEGVLLVSISLRSSLTFSSQKTRKSLPESLLHSFPPS
jgi:hypothetical protein